MNFFGVLYIADWLLILVGLIICIYDFLAWRYKELRDLGIPGPKPSVPLGNIALMFKLGALDFDKIMVDRYGRIFGTYQGRDPIITIADVDICRKVLIRDFDSFTDRNQMYIRGMLAHSLFDTNGNRWRHMRRKLTPAFTSGKLKQMMTIIKKTVDTFVENLASLAESGKIFEVKELCNAFTSDNIAATSFGFELNTQKTPDHPFLKFSRLIMDIKITSPLVFISIFMPYVAKQVEKIKPSSLPDGTESYFGDLLRQAIHARQNNGSSKKDLIQIILDAEKDLQKLDDETKSIFNEGLGTMTESDKQGLSEEEVISNLLLFLLAGHETTSSSLSFILYSLATNPDVQKQLVDELDSVVGDKDVTYDMLAQLTYLDMVINESLRMYPIAFKVDRKAVRDMQYGDLHIPEGMLIGIPIRYFHYNENIWPNPSKFDRMRFSPAEKRKRDPLYFMPFGQGPRMCIGMRFALLTLKVALVGILQKFTLLQCEKTEIPLKMRKAAIHLTADKGIWLKVQRR